MRKSLFFLLLTSVLLMGCHHAQSNSEDSFSTSSLPSISNRELPDEKTISVITNDFYEQSFKAKGITDDSSFCGYYEPREISINSFVPIYYYGCVFNETYIFTYMINGFHVDSIEAYSIDFDENNELYFKNFYTGNDFHKNYYSQHLMPQVWQSGKIYTIAEAYQKKVIDKDIFECVIRYRDGKRVSTNYTFSVVAYLEKEIGKEYFDNLPPLVSDKQEHRSLLINRFERIKQRFYQQEIVAKGIEDDSVFRTYYRFQQYKDAVKAIDYNSIHLHSFLDVTDDFYIYILIINDIEIEIDPGYGDSYGRSIILGEKRYSINHQIEPVVVIGDELHFMTDAYELGILNETLLEQLDATIFYKVYLESTADANHKYINLESKTLERSFYVNPVL